MSNYKKIENSISSDPDSMYIINNKESVFDRVYNAFTEIKGYNNDKNYNDSNLDSDSDSDSDSDININLKSENSNRLIINNYVNMDPDMIHVIEIEDSIYKDQCKHKYKVKEDTLIEWDEFIQNKFNKVNKCINNKKKAELCGLFTFYTTCLMGGIYLCTL